MNHHHLFLSCDWGTSSFRLRLIDKTDLQVIISETSDTGNAQIFNQWKNRKDEEISRLAFYTAFLRDCIAQFEQKLQLDLKNVTLVISGMASSTIGMVELPYQELPFSLDGSDLLLQKIEPNDTFPYPIVLVSGVRSDQDVMRGEEVQLIGCNADIKIKEQIFIIPGTHSKHVFTNYGKVVAFNTYITGELFSLLSTHSILSNSIQANGDFKEKDYANAFEKGLLYGLSLNILNALFQVRTNDLFNKLSKKENFYYLSGLLLGVEFKSLLDKKDTSITLISNEILAPQYQFALETLVIGSSRHYLSVDEALITGHLKILNANLFNVPN